MIAGGGLLYTIGVGFYLWQGLPYHLTIWHTFVLIASLMLYAGAVVAVGATPLDDVPGVGATRKRALLAHFGSAKAVGRANLTDLKAVDGISDALAETIYDHFHGS